MIDRMHDGRQCRCHVAAEFQALGGGLQANHVDELIDEFGGPHFIAIELEAPGLDL